MIWSPAHPKKKYTCIRNVPMVGSGIQTNVGQFGKSGCSGASAPKSSIFLKDS